MKPIRVFLFGVIVCVFSAAPSANAEVKGWLHWRGPNQNGTSMESELPEKFELDGESHLFTNDLRGRGTPVVSNGLLYVGSQTQLYAIEAKD